MGKPIILEEPIIVGVRKIHPYSGSSAITIPKSAITFLKLNIGDRLVFSVDVKNEKIVMAKPKHMEDVKSGGSYKLGIPKELYERQLKE